MEWVIRRWGLLRRLVQTFGPYLIVEIVFPGGSLIALALFVYQQKRLPFGRDLLAPALAWVRKWS
jgi:hypothetical protein